MHCWYVNTLLEFLSGCIESLALVVTIVIELTRQAETWLACEMYYNVTLHLTLPPL